LKLIYRRKAIEVEKIATIYIPGKKSQEIFVRCIMQMYNNKEEVDGFPTE